MTISAQVERENVPSYSCCPVQALSRLDDAHLHGILSLVFQMLTSSRITFIDTPAIMFCQLSGHLFVLQTDTLKELSQYTMVFNYEYLLLYLGRRNEQDDITCSFCLEHNSIVSMTILSGTNIVSPLQVKMVRKFRNLFQAQATEILLLLCSILYPFFKIFYFINFQ